MGAKISFIENKKSSPLKGIGKHSNLKLKTKKINIIFLYIMIVYYLKNLF